MSETPKSVAIIGANLAGGWAADTLRQSGFEGDIFLIGDEPDPPYERPPLSKDLLLHPQAAPKTLFLHDLDYYAQQRIELRLGVRASKLDLPSRRVELADGGQISADRIILCTGGDARRLPIPGSQLPQVHCLRTLADSRAIAAGLAPGKSVVVVGGGVIGLEVAASAAKAGCAVTVLEAAPGLMSRVVTPEIGQFLLQYHRAEGVDIRLGQGIAAILGAHAVQAVETSEGTRIDADMVVLGVGIDPADSLAREAGIATDNGIIVDAHCRTSAPGIFAAGDVANQPNPYLGGRARLENVQNAQNQGAAAAQAILGSTAPFEELPYFWTDQFDLNVQAAGDILHAEQTILRGTLESRAFSVFYLAQGTVRGTLTVNQPKDMAHGRRMIMRHLRPDPAALADPGSDLRQIVKTAS